MGAIEMSPVARVRGGRAEAIDDDWGTVEAAIEFDEGQFSPEALAGLEAFSHVDVVYVFDQVDPATVNLTARHPRGNTAWPKVGIFAQRAKARPNRIGVTTCELIGVSDLTLSVRGLDAIDGSPVLDVKPHMEEFGPRIPVREPAWARELMRGYW